MKFEDCIQALIQGQNKPPLDPSEAHPDQLERLADFGIVNPGYAGPGGLTSVKSARLSTEVKAWVANIVEGKRANAAFFDTTTIFTIEKLLNAEEGTKYLTPETLLDLCTFVNGVVLHDRIFHLENPAIDSLKFNEALGNQPVFISLPLGSYGLENDWDGVNSLEALLIGFWDLASEYLSILAEATEENGADEDREMICKGWETILGRPLGASGIFADSPNHKWSSVNEALLKQMLDVSGFEGKGKGVYSGYAYDLKDSTRDFVSECNQRSLFNRAVAQEFLEVPYMPSIPRLPFNNFMYNRATKLQHHLASAKLQHHLASVKYLDDEYQRHAKVYDTPSSSNLFLPFFPAVVLANVSSLSEFFEELALIRRKAEPFRSHRKEFDEAISGGRDENNTAGALRKAIDQDTKYLRDLFPYAPISGGIAAVIAALSGQLPLSALIAIGVLTAASQSESYVERLRKRVLRPRYTCLTDMKDVADGLKKALPKIAQLWGGLNDGKQKWFAQRFDKLRGLQFA